MHTFTHVYKHSFLKNFPNDLDYQPLLIQIITSATLTLLQMTHRPWSRALCGATLEPLKCLVHSPATSGICGWTF